MLLFFLYPLSRLLHPFINTNTHISVLFTVAPTIKNAPITDSTLKFAVQAGMVKVKPIAAGAKKNIKALVKKLENVTFEQTIFLNKKKGTDNTSIHASLPPLSPTDSHAPSMTFFFLGL